MPTEITDVLTYGVLAFVGFRLATGLRYTLASRGRTLFGTIVTGVRWRHVWPVPFVLAAVVAAASLLVQLPGLSWGWWSAIGGVGSPITGSNDATVGTIWEWLIPVVFVAMLFPALPMFAYAEESIFRRGAQNWSRVKRVVKVMEFGLVHALVGIPIGFAMALGVGGAYFMYVYLRAFRRVPLAETATLESTRAHFVYNAVIISLVAVVIVSQVFG